MQEIKYFTQTVLIASLFHKSCLENSDNPVVRNILYRLVLSDKTLLELLHLLLLLPPEEIVSHRERLVIIKHMMLGSHLLTNQLLASHKNFS